MRWASHSTVRRFIPRALLTVAFWLAVNSVPLQPAAAQDSTAGDFDYLVLTLSWSPTYCASSEGRNDRDQCRPDRRYAFVVHGLWPQQDRSWPEYCETSERYVPEHTIDRMLSIMPSKRLVIHEWRKHGSCFGTQDDYFAAIHTLFSQIRVPARYLSPQAPVAVTPKQLVADFVKTNPRLSEKALSVHCGNARDRANLQELRICYDLGLNPRACGANERRSCQARQLILPPVR